MPTSKKPRARDERFEKPKTWDLRRFIWENGLPPGGFNKTLIKSVQNVDTAEDLAEAMPSVTETAGGGDPILDPYFYSQSSSETEASLARETSSTTVVNAHKPWKRNHEVLRIMKLGEPGRLALLASTYFSAESRARLTKPGEPEISWEEVKAAVRESTLISPLKRKFDDDDEEKKGETPRPAKMSRFEERTALDDVYAFPTDPSTTYHPTRPRRLHKRSADDGEQLHRPKKQRCHGMPSMFEPRRMSATGDEISPIFGSIKHPRFDALGYESARQGPKEVDWSVPLNYPASSVPKVEVESLLINSATPSIPKLEAESSLLPAQAITGTACELINYYATKSLPKAQVERSPSPPPAEAITNTITPSSQPPQDTQISIPESPPTQRANASHSDSGSGGEEVEDISLEGAQGRLRKARHRARRSRNKHLVKKMEESRRLAKALGPIKHTGTRPPISINDKDEEVYEPLKQRENSTEPTHNVVEKTLEIGNEARRRGAGFWTAESDVEKAQREKMKKDREELIKMSERILKHIPREESRLRRWES